ncbi:MAG TPA: hypothetical protein VFV81_10200 [Verrucomicrobiae bacterium]|nr:hypothetical protein [Verrucomicrobiae bacterium]
MSYSAVSAAVASAVAGDVVQLPMGTNTWTQGVTLNGVSLIGAGTNATVIIDEAPRYNNGIPLVTIHPASGSLTEVAQFTIREGVTNTSYNYNGEIQAFGDAPDSWRIDHIVFDSPYAKSIIYWGHPYAVIDHCTFRMRAEGVIGYDEGYGDSSWASPPNYGMSNMVYVEDCYFTNVIGWPAAATDGDEGGRMVFRHNTIMNDYCPNHGTESSQRYRSMRLMEIYDNTFTYTRSPFTWAIQSRGGTGVIFSNTATGFYNFCGLMNYRDGESFVPWGGATGNNPWDTNDPSPYFSGVASNPNGSQTLMVNNVNWNPNQWWAYSVDDTNTGGFSIITGNTSNTISVYPSKDNGPMTFNNGDHIVIYRVQYALDQIGRGSGDLIQGDGPPYGSYENVATVQPNWPHEVSEPLYVWGNTLNGNPTGAESDYPNIQQGRDYINGTPKPGYTPFTYPHPLTFVSAGNNGGSNTNSTGGGTTNSTPSWPVPPTGVKIISHTP